MTRIFSRSNLIYLITDQTIAGLSHSQIVQQALSAGIRTIQLREKKLSKKELYREAVAVRSYASRYNAIFIINDYVDMAMAVGADGVHLGQEDMPIDEARRILGRKKIIGVSTHNLKEALRAQQSGADYIGFGPIFETKTKDAGRPRGVKGLNDIRKHIKKLPIVAIGGITCENINTVLDSGADACAIASGILSGDIKANVRKFRNVLK